MSDSPDLEPTGAPQADAEVEALLGFTPVPRKVRRPDGWTADLQRRFIALLAMSGSPARAASAMGKKVSGIEGVYRDDEQGEFRAAWDEAVEIASRRRAQAWGAAAAPEPPRLRRSAARDEGADWGEPEMSDERKLELLGGLAERFMRKVGAEREARIKGEIVTADFFLRQITALEVMFDLHTGGEDIRDAWDMLHAVRRRGHGYYAIVDTPFSRWLDGARRAYWEASGDPERPPAHPEEFLVTHGQDAFGPLPDSCRTARDHHVYGATTDPARGYSAEQWGAMDYAAQKAAREKQFAQDAAAQVEWERRAREAWEKRQGEQE